MSYRKVQKTRKGTFLISLPKEWAASYSINKEDTLLVMEQPDGSLTIRPPYNKGREISAKIKYAPYIDRYITWSYLMGVDTLEIISDSLFNNKQKDEIKDAIKKLAGFEVIDEKEDRIIIGTLMEAGQGSTEKYIKKELYIATGMEREAINSYLKGDRDGAKEVEERDDEVDRLYFLLVRLSRTAISNPYVGEKLGLNPIRALDVREASEILENLADYAVKISIMALEKPSFDAEILSAVNQFSYELISLQEQALEAILNHAFSQVPVLLETKGKLVKLIDFPVNPNKCDLVSLLNFKAALIQILERSYDLIDLVSPSGSGNPDGDLIFEKIQ